MTLADHLDPGAPGVVNVRGDSSNGASRGAGNGSGPQLGRQVFDQIHRDAIVCAPRRNQRLAVFRIFQHARLLKKVFRLHFACVEHVNRITTRQRTQYSLQENFRNRF